jgi:type I restriction enzyme S subunit
MIDGLKPYSAYKDSGVSWLGEVPAHWDIGPGFSMFREKKVKNTGMIESQVLSLSYGRIVIKPPEKLHGLVPASFETYQIVNPDDIIIRPTDLQNDWNSLRVGLTRDRGIITSAYMCLRTVEPTIPEYGYLLLHAYDLKKIFYGMGSGLRQNLDFSNLKRMPVLIPPVEEQHAIAAFLEDHDRLTRRYIRAQRRLIELLTEQKQTLIQQAVTRGLDLDVPLKDSGIEWLGEIPELWDERPAKYFFREVDERSQSGEEELLSVSHITGVTPRSQKNVTMFKAESYVGYKLCQKNDLVINTMWAWMAALGVAKQTGIVSSSYAVYRPIDPDAFVPEYVDHLLRTKPYVSEYICRSTGIRASRLRLYPEQFLKIPLICPPYEQQKRIAKFVEGETFQVDHAITRTQRQIDLVREYRTRLIADVVTGKLDVRGVSLPDLDEAIGLGDLDDMEDNTELDDLDAEEWDDADD